MFVKNKSLARRTVLRGIGAAVGLPFIDAMVPAFGATAPPTRRFGAIYFPNGAIMQKFTPAAPEFWN